MELSQRELWLLSGSLEVSIAAMADPHGMGVADPEREGELQELRDVLKKLHGALAEPAD